MKRFYIIILLATLACSCQKEVFQEEDGGATTLSVALEDTKTSITAPDDQGVRTVTWLAGDKINANGQDSNPLETGGGKTASFTFPGTLTPPFNVIYPASFYKDATHIVLPYSQNKMPGDDNIATDTFPMYGAATSAEHIPVKHLCSMVKFQVSCADSVKLAYLEFFGNNGEQICGNFEIDYSTGVLTGADGDALSKSVRCFSLKTAKDGGTVICNIVIPAGTYSKGFTVRAVASNGDYMDKKVSTSRTFAAGESVKYPAFEFVPSGKLDALCISSAEQLIAFANDWNNYKYEGCNANVSFISDIVFDEATSAEFVKTAGIGRSKTPDGVGTNHYNGVFDGNGFSVKNLTSSVPLFATTGGGADIKNIVIDESCVFTCTAGGTSDWGVLAGRQKGEVSNCTSYAQVNIEANTNSDNRNIGGMVGRVYDASFQNNTFAGTMNFPEGTFSQNDLYIGGLIGTVDGSSDASAVSEILDNSFEGSISLSDGTTYGGPECAVAKKYINLGGVVGYVKKANVIDGCTSSSSAALIMGGKYSVHAGGIVGNSKGGSIKNCTNAANIKYSSNGGRNATTPTVVGGILGLGNGTSMSHCTNTAKVETHCNSTTLAIGGLVGQQKGLIDNCSNSGEVFRYNAGAAADQGNRYVSVGGIVGTLDSGSTVSNTSNSGKMYSQDACTSTNSTYDVGGIVGSALGSNTIANCECTSPEIRSRGKKGVDPNPALTRHDIGGIAGNLVSTAVSGCTVNGVLLVNLYSVNCLEGGICGTMDASSSISSSNVIDCKCQYDSGVEGNKFGAIAGTTVSSSSINDCKLSGKWSVDGGENWTDFTIDDITSGTAFTGSGNELYTKVYNLTGTVKCGGSGLANVVVSDGYSSTLTDKNGVYYLQARDSATCVNVSVPSGYMVSSSGGVPAFWKKLSTVSASSGIKTVDFTLKELSNPDKFTIYMYADVQVRPTTMWYDYFAFHSGDVAADLFSDIKDRANAAGGNIIGISLGDQIHQDQSAYKNYYLSSNELGKLSFPNFSLIGNHDYDLSASDYIGGAANFETLLSPVRYSLNIGKFHIVVVDNARTKGVGGDPVGETKGMPLSALEWLKSDLKYIPASTPIILCSHRPLFMELYTGEEEPRLRDISTRSWALGTEYAGILSGYKKVYAFNGDVHNVFNYAYTSGAKRNIECHGVARATGELWVNQFLNMCGTPRGYLEIKLDDEQLTYKFKPVAYQTGSCNKSPSPMTFRDFSLTDGKFYMKSSYLSAKGALLDDFYQIHAYAPGAGYGAATKYPNDVIALVFMYDDRWSDVTFEYSGGSTVMTRIGLEEDLRDPGYTWQYTFYKANGLKNEPGYDNSYPLYNAFRCTPPSGVTTGTIKVTDHFGNSYENKISW